MIRKSFLSAVTLVLALVMWAGQQSAPVKVIFDTDMYTDFDDVGALACLHALADEEKCEVLATVSSTRGTPSVGVCEVINAWYGRGDLPVGAPREIGVDGSGNPGYAYPLYQRLVRDRKAPHPTSDTAPDANEVYRRVLTAQPDGSVTICSVGFTTNLRRLLETKGDVFSPLDGKALVAKKVKAWYAMACRYPEGTEFNSAKDAESSRIAFRDWPTPVYFVDWWLGGAVRCGESVAGLADADNPVSQLFRESLEMFKERGKGHPSWDQVTVLAAVCGWESHFGVERGRFRIVDKDGRNAWTADANGPHRRLFAKTPSKRLGEILDELMARPPANCSSAARGFGAIDAAN